MIKKTSRKPSYTQIRCLCQIIVALIVLMLPVTNTLRLVLACLLYTSDAADEEDSVLEANRQLFESDFELTVNSSLQLNNITYNQITIRFENEVIDVMDVIKFNKDFEIESIRAYKG